MHRVSLNGISELEAKGLRVMDMEWLEEKVESVLNRIIFDRYFKSEENVHQCCDKGRDLLGRLRSKASEIRRMFQRTTKLN